MRSVDNPVDTLWMAWSGTLIRIGDHVEKLGVHKVNRVCHSVDESGLEAVPSRRSPPFGGTADGISRHVAS